MPTAHTAPLATWKDFFFRLYLRTGVGYLATAYVVSRWLTRQHRGRSSQTPADFDLVSQPLTCRTSDGFRLVGWVIEPSTPSTLGTVALFHGLSHSRQQTIGRTRQFIAAGFRVVAFDARAHGESGGRVASFGWFERFDVQAVAALIASRWPSEQRFAVGISMGAAAICFAAVEATPWHGVVLESIYSDILRTFNNRIGRNYPSWYRELIAGVVWLTQKRFGVRLEHLSPCEHVRHLCAVPTLVVTGASDESAPPEHAESVAASHGTATCAVLPGAGHRDLFETDPEAYRACVVEFVKRVAR